MFNEIVIARYKAHVKYGDNSLESGHRMYMTDVNTLYPVQFGPYVPDWDNKQNRILVEEIGEISKAMNEYALGNINYVEYEEQLASEIMDSIAVLSAWYDKLVGYTIQDRINQFESEAGCDIQEVL